MTALPPAPDGTVQALADAFPTVSAFGSLIAEVGVERGLVGPREVPILWERHLLNSAAVSPLLPPDGLLVDVGSGAGFPGVVLAAMRPDLEVVLLEPMERRVVWLEEAVERLGLTNARVLRARAEEQHGRLRAAAVTARAVASLDKLAGWTLPLLEQGGSLLALKGGQAAVELEASRDVLARLGGDGGEVVEVSCPPGGPSTFVVRVTRVAAPVPPAPVGRSSSATSASGKPAPRASRSGRGRGRRGGAARGG